MEYTRRGDIGHDVSPEVRISSSRRMAEWDLLLLWLDLRWPWGRSFNALGLRFLRVDTSCFCIPFV